MSEGWLTSLGLQKSEASPASEARRRGEIYNRTQCVIEPSLLNFVVQHLFPPQQALSSCLQCHFMYREREIVTTPPFT